VLTDQKDYFLATYDADPEFPERKSLPYGELENILDNIPSRNKLLLIDACHSGEVDKDNDHFNTVKINNAEGRGMKNLGLTNNNISESDLEDSFEMMNTLFADIRKGTGAVIIGAARGKEEAGEGGMRKRGMKRRKEEVGEKPEDEPTNTTATLVENGWFTYAFLEAMRTHRADTDKDGILRISEVRNYMIEEVKKISEGQQTPTSRRENLENDFVVIGTAK
jgi:hypothetical protein